jgi:hypothetical protein
MAHEIKRRKKEAAVGRLSGAGEPAELAARSSPNRYQGRRRLRSRSPSPTGFVVEVADQEPAWAV